MTYFSFIEACIQEFDTALRTLLPPPTRSPHRASPACDISEAHLTAQEKKQVAALMRVNHAGEVCAQALYQGQARTAKLSQVRQKMEQAAAEETDHLAWCEQRLKELDSKASVLNPLWYLGSLMIGAFAGLAGDRYSLGFVAETEQQVGAHLKKHLMALPVQDKKTQAILEKMHQDETLHAEEALHAGGIILPDLIKQIMHLMSKIMTTTSYHI